jgi:hypothetical protein
MCGGGGSLIKQANGKDDKRNKNKKKQICTLLNLHRTDTSNL